MGKATAKNMRQSVATELSRRLAAREAEVMHLRYETDLRARRLELLVQSRSWRMTRPLRFFADALYKAFKRVVLHPFFPTELLKFRRRVLRGYVSMPCSCLQLAPSFAPLLYDRQANIKTLDFYNTEEQKQLAKVAGRDPTRVVKVDYVCRDGRYERTVKEKFDLVIGGEGAILDGDLVRQLQSLRKLLEPGGLLLIDFADRRYGPECYRFTTSLGHFISEYMQDEKRGNKQSKQDAPNALASRMLALEKAIYRQPFYQDSAAANADDSAAPAAQQKAPAAGFNREASTYVFEFEDTVLRALLPLCAMGLLDYDLVEARMSHHLGRFAVLLRAGRRKTGWHLLEKHYEVAMHSHLGKYQDSVDKDAEQFGLNFRRAADGEEIIRLKKQPQRKRAALGSRAGGRSRAARYAEASDVLATSPMRAECCGLEPDLVSVVLPVYNQAELLKESVKSVLAQTYRNLELIIINDGSEDNIKQVLDSYAPGGDAADSRVRCYSQDNQTLPKALTAGFRLARGEFWCWTSADNLMLPEMLDHLVEKLRGEPELGMVYADYYAIDDSGALLRDKSWRPINRPDPDSGIIHLPRNTRDLNTVQDNFIGPCFLYRGWIGQLLGDYAPVMGVEDYDYWMRVNAFFPLRHLGSGEPLYKYRVHDNTLSAKAGSLKIERKVGRLMELERERAAFFNSPMNVAADTVGREAMQGLSGGPKLLPACDRQGVLLEGLAEAAELLVVGSATAERNLDALLELMSAHDTSVAVILEYEERGCLRLRQLLRQPGCIAIASDPLSGARARLFADCPILDLNCELTMTAVLAFARNRQHFHRTWSSEQLSRQPPRHHSPPAQSHVLLQVDDFMQGGMENVVMDLAGELRHEGYDTTIGILGKRGPAADQAEARGLRAEVLSKVTPQDYVKYLQQNRVSIVNAHYSIFAAAECKQAGIPFVETVHNSYVWLSPEQIDGYRQADEHLSAYICVSDTAAYYADIALGLDPAKMRVIANGIDTAAIGNGAGANGSGSADKNDKPEGKVIASISALAAKRAFNESRARLRKEWGVPDAAPVFLNVASIMATKAQLTQVQAFAQVLKEHPDARLVLLGGVMEKPYMKQVEAAVKKLGIGERVVFAGYQSDAPSYYHAADVFLLPSYWEGWSLSLAEAAVSGLHSVITDVGSAYEFAGDPRVEIVSPPFGDMASLNYSNLRDYLYAEHPKFTDAVAAAMLQAAAKLGKGRRSAPDAELAARFDRRRAYANYAELFRVVCNQPGR